MAGGRALRFLPIAVAATVGFVVGITTRGLGVVGRAESEVGTTSDAPQPAATPVPAAAPRDGGSGPGLSAATGGGAVDAERARLASEVERLTAKVAELERSRGAGGTEAPKKGPRFTFGEMGTLDAVRNADWQEMAEASRIVAATILDMQRKSETGEPVPKETLRTLQENTERVRKYEYRTIDKIPTAALHNGELTHPITLANLLAAMLEEVGHPLSAGQADEIERLGLAFDADFVRLRAGWTDAVARARRILEEFRRKERFDADVWALLSPEQRAAWVDPKWRGVAGADLFDATLMVIHTTTVVAKETRDELKKSLAATVRAKAGLAADALAPRLDAAVDAFLARTARLLDPVAKALAKRYTSDDALLAGEATADLVDSLLADGEATPAAKKSLFDDPTWVLPRLLR